MSKKPLPELPKIILGLYRHTMTGKLVRVTGVSWDEETLDGDSPRARVNYEETNEVLCPSCQSTRGSSYVPPPTPEPTTGASWGSCADVFHRTHVFSGAPVIPPVSIGRIYSVFTGEILRDGKPDRRFKYVGP